MDGSPRSFRWTRALLSGAQGSQNAQSVNLGYTEVPAENSNRIDHRKGSPTSKPGLRQVHHRGGMWMKPIENSVMLKSCHEKRMTRHVRTHHHPVQGIRLVEACCFANIKEGVPTVSDFVTLRCRFNLNQQNCNRMDLASTLY